jgi:hypothetical protein
MKTLLLVIASLGVGLAAVMLPLFGWLFAAPIPGAIAAVFLGGKKKKPEQPKAEA